MKRVRVAITPAEVPGRPDTKGGNADVFCQREYNGMLAN